MRRDCSPGHGALGRGEKSRGSATAGAEAVGFLLRHAVYGAIAALAAFVAILQFDIANLNRLILSSDDKWLASAMLFLGLTVTLSSVAIGIGVFLSAEEDSH